MFTLSLIHILDAQIKVQQEAVAAEQRQNELSVSQAQRRLEDARNQKAIDEEATADWDQAERDAKLRQDSLCLLYTSRCV